MQLMPCAAFASQLTKEESFPLRVVMERTAEVSLSSNVGASGFTTKDFSVSASGFTSKDAF